MKTKFNLLILITIFFFSSCSNKKKNSTEFVESGYSKYVEGKYEEALEFYTQAIETWEGNWVAYNSRSMVYREQGELEKALADLNNAEKIENFDKKLVYENRANLKYDMKDYSGSLNDYNKLIAINSTNSNYYGNRADCFRNLGDLDKAFADYDKTVELDSTNYLAIFQRGKIRLKKQDITSAIEDYNKALKINENDNIYVARGIAYGIMIDYQKSIADFDKALEINPQNAAAYYNRALSKKNSGIKYGKFNICKDLYEATKLNHREATQMFEEGGCKKKYKFEKE